MMGDVIWVSALSFVFYAGWLDGKARRIPNWLTISGLSVGIVLHLVYGGLHGALVAVEGASLGLAILLPLVFLRAVGAGDWKLVGALGSFVGPQMLWFVLFASILVAALMAGVLVVRANRVRETMRNMAILVMGFFVFGFRANAEISLDNPGLLKLPFGVAAALGTLICFVAAQWRS